MTDTPRTRAELLSIFADAQGPAQITPQDMRDFVVSNPSGSLMSRAAYFRYYYAPGLITLPASANNTSYGQQTVLPFDPAGAHVLSPPYDPNGWAGGNSFLDGGQPENAWAVDVPADAAVMLPPGMYSTDLVVNWTSDGYAFSSSDSKPEVFSVFDQALYDPDGPPASLSVPYIYANYLGPYNWMSQYFNVITSSPHDIVGLRTVSTLVNDTTAPQPFIALAYTAAFTQSVTVNYYQLKILRIG